MPEVKLGETQKSVLCSIVEHKGWHSNCGWVWTTVHGTQKYLDRLVELGLVRKGVRTLPPHDHEKMFYEATRDGRYLAEKITAERAEAYRKTKAQEQLDRHRSTQEHQAR